MRLEEKLQQVVGGYFLKIHSKSSRIHLLFYVEAIISSCLKSALSKNCVLGSGHTHIKVVFLSKSSLLTVHELHFLRVSPGLLYHSHTLLRILYSLLDHFESRRLLLLESRSLVGFFHEGLFQSRPFSVKRRQLCIYVLQF